MTLTVNTHILLSNHLAVSIDLCSGHRLQEFPNNPLFSLFPIKKSKFRHSLDIMRQTACLVFKPIMVEGYAALFSYTTVVQASDSMTASM